MRLTDQKKRQIIKAATSEFLQLGFQGCSMDQIAQRAQVSKRTVYNHFASKEILFFSILEHLSSQDNEVFSRGYNPERSIKNQLIEIAKQEVELLQSDEIQQFSRIMLGELVRSVEMARMFEKQRPSCQADFAVWLNAAIADNTLQIDDVEFATEQFFGLIRSSAFWPTLLRQRTLNDAEKQKIITSTVSMFLKSYSKA